MKVNELRIGNWVYNPIQKIPLKVDLTLLHLIALDVINETIKEGRFQPIPLTEEILLKCGFCLDEHSEYFIVNEDINFDLSDGAIRVFDGWLFLEVKHLHQLQNLYFALTGEELDIEL